MAHVPVKLSHPSATELAQQPCSAANPPEYAPRTSNPLAAPSTQAAGAGGAKDAGRKPSVSRVGGANTGSPTNDPSTIAQSHVTRKRRASMVDSSAQSVVPATSVSRTIKRQKTDYHQHEMAAQDRDADKENVAPSQRARRAALTPMDEQLTPQNASTHQNLESHGF